LGVAMMIRLGTKAQDKVFFQLNVNSIDTKINLDGELQATIVMDIKDLDTLETNIRAFHMESI
jgi:hypothetical protein